MARSCARRLDRQDNLILGKIGLRPLAGLAFPDKIDATIMGDPEEPGTQSPRIVKRIDLPVGLEQRLLHDVFAIEHRSGHARAIAMQAQAQMRQRFEESGVAHIEETARVDSWLHLHGVNDFPGIMLTAPSRCLWVQRGKYLRMTTPLRKRCVSNSSSFTNDGSTSSNARLPRPIRAGMIDRWYSSIS